MPPLCRIVLTGGPCAGKSIAQGRISAHLMRNGIHVLRVPEAATLLLGGGIHVAGQPAATLLAFQRGVVQVQTGLEQAFSSFAQATDAPMVLLLDRGIMDGAAYLTDEGWQDVIVPLGLTPKDVFGRYDAVIHLVTCAIGAESFYGTDTNVVRYETVAQAAAVDVRLREVWSPHRRHEVIDNSCDFERKLWRTVSAVSDIVGVRRPREPED